MLYEWDYVRHIVMVKLPNDVISHTKQDFDSEDAQLVESHLQKYGVEASLRNCGNAQKYGECLELYMSCKLTKICMSYFKCFLLIRVGKIFLMSPGSSHSPLWQPVCEALCTCAQLHGGHQGLGLRCKEIEESLPQEKALW